MISLAPELACSSGSQGLQTRQPVHGGLAGFGVTYSLIGFIVGDEVQSL